MFLGRYTRLYCPPAGEQGEYARKGLDSLCNRAILLRSYGITRNALACKESVVTDQEQGTVQIKEKPADLIGTVRDAVNRALKNRENVVMVRVSGEALRNLDMLVEAGITKSRSESVAFLVNEGIRASSQLFERIEELTSQITALRQQLSAIVAEETDLDI